MTRGLTWGGALSCALAAACGSGSSSPPDAIAETVDAPLAPDPTDAGAALDAAPDAASLDAGAPDAETPDAGSPDAAPPDAMPPDAMVGCFPAGDYVEGEEATNNLADIGSASEITGLSIGPGGAPVAIGGCVATTTANATDADGDFFALTVTGSTTLVAELTWSTSTPPTHRLILELDGASLPDYWLAGGGNQGVVIGRPIAVAAGSYRAGIVVDLPSPAVEYSYQLRIRELTSVCTPLSGIPDYSEADETGAGHRANDMALIAFDSVNPTYVYGITPTAGVDTPEATGLTVDAGASRLLGGSSADVSTAGDSYRDRDAFAITAGAGVQELHVVVEWGQPGVDLDMWVFAADVNAQAGTGHGYFANQEEAILRATPGATYWVWVGLWDYAGGFTLPEPYSVTVCAR